MKQILPVHPPPLEDELLSSWMVRLARANAQKLHTFTRLLYPSQPRTVIREGYTRTHRSTSVWARDIDRTAKPDLLERLSQRTPLSLERLRATTLGAYEGFLFERHIVSSGAGPWIMPLGIRSTKHRGYGLQCCPQCLAADREPYFRRAWRLAFVTVCPTHRTLLLDRCPNCQAPIAFHHLEYGGSRAMPSEKPITTCAGCGLDLRDAPLESFSSDKYLPIPLREHGLKRGYGEKPISVRSIRVTRLVHFQAWLSLGLEQGFFDLDDLTERLSCRLGANDWRKRQDTVVRPVYSHLVFAGLHEVVRLLMFGKRGDALRRLLRGSSHTRLLSPIAGTRQRPPFEQLSVAERHKVMAMLAYLMQDFPNRFVHCLTEAKVVPSFVWCQRDPAPFWLEEAFDDWRAINI